MSRCVRALAVALVALLVAVAFGPQAVAEPFGDGSYRPPVDAPITDAFRPPEHAYGPGNRGIEYATEPGTEVRSIAAGEVTFAGQVGGTLHVTVLHVDGLRSTVSYLRSIAVRRGETVVVGQPLGTAAGRTHLGIRAGDEYLDPAVLFAKTSGTVRLVPTDEAASSSAGAERAAIAAWIRGQPSRLEQGGAWLRDRAVDAATAARRLSSAVDPTRFVTETGVELFERLADRSPCTPPQHRVERPAERRVVILVGGLGSTSGNAAVDELDVTALGYDDADTYRFSYRGGRVPDEVDRHQNLMENPYDAEDSQAGLASAGDELRALVSDLARLEPGVPIDIVAHSQGGLVARAALHQMDLASETDTIGVVVTLGTPHLGADLASAAAAVRGDGAAAAAFEAADRVLGTGIDLGSPSMRQLEIGSDFTDDLAGFGVPDDVSFTSVSARGDLVVAASRTRVAGAANVTIPLIGVQAHDALASDAATTREIGLAIAGQPPTCESSRDTVLDVLGGDLVARTEELLVAGVFAGGALVPG